MQQGDIIAGIVVVWFAMTAAGQLHGKCRHADVEVGYPRQAFFLAQRGIVHGFRETCHLGMFGTQPLPICFSQSSWSIDTSGSRRPLEPKKQVRVCDDCFKTIGDHHVRKLSKSLWYFRVFLRLHVVKLLTSLIARFVVSKYPQNPRLCHGAWRAFAFGASFFWFMRLRQLVPKKTWS